MWRREVYDWGLSSTVLIVTIDGTYRTRWMCAPETTGNRSTPVATIGPFWWRSAWAGAPPCVANAHMHSGAWSSEMAVLLLHSTNTRYIGGGLR